MTITSAIADSVRAALEQVAPTCDVALVSAAIANNATAALQADPVELARAALRLLSARELRIYRMPAGYHVVDLAVETEDDAAALADFLGMPEPQPVSHGRNRWVRSEKGEYGQERLTIVGGHRPVAAVGKAV